MTDMPPRASTGAPLTQVRQLLRTLKAPEDVLAMYEALCADLRQRTGAETLEDIRTSTDDGGNPILVVRGVPLDARFQTVRPYDQMPWTCTENGKAPQGTSPWTRGNTPGRM